MKLIHDAICMCALLTVAKYSHAQSASEATHHEHAPQVPAAVVDAPAVNPLREAGVAQTERVAALTAIAKSSSISVAAATLAQIEACDACLARNDLASILAAQPTADLKALAPMLVSKGNEATKDANKDANKDAGKDAVTQSSSRFVKAACVRAIFALPENERPTEASAWKPVTLKTTCVPGKMSWDPKEFTVAPNSIVAIEMTNPDSMQHNLLVCAPGSLSEIGVAADKLGEGAIGKRREYVPDSPKVLEIMGLTAPNTTGVLWFIAPAKPGTYPLVCTYPGHWRMMNGKLKVQ
jgi:azurin